MKNPACPNLPAKHLHTIPSLLLAACIVTVSSPAQAAVRSRPSHATGGVEIQWNGRGGPSHTPKRAFAALAAFPSFFAKAPRGRFIYAVMNPDNTPHRLITAELFQVTSIPSEHKAWMTGMVVSDEKFHYCSGNHETDATHTDDACGDNHQTDASTHTNTIDTPLDETTHDSSCSHDDSTETTHDEGGCSDTHDTDGETHEDGCSGSSGHDGGSNHPKGKDSRTGQIVMVKLFDGGSTGAQNDHITWKWFAEPANETELQTWLDLDPSIEPTRLCKKTIVGGNLTVHGSP